MHQRACCPLGPRQTNRSSPSITEEDVEEFRDTMVWVLDMRNEMPGKNDYVKQDFHFSERVINPDGVGSPIPFIDLAVNKEEEAQLAQAVRESLGDNGPASRLANGGTQGHTVTINVLALSSTRSRTCFHLDSSL